VWILDAAPLRQSSPELGKNLATLFKPDIATRWGFEPSRGPIYGGGSRRYRGENPPNGATIHYLVTAKTKEKPKLEIYDIQGELVRTLEGNQEAGWHKLVWDFRRGPVGGANRPASTTPQPVEGRRGSGGPARSSGPREGQFLPAGDYRLELKVDGQTYKQVLRIEEDPNQPRPIAEGEPAWLEGASEIGREPRD
jgi:hypothetical protein